MVGIPKIIHLDQNLVNSNEFQDLIKSRGLSRFVNRLLMDALNVSGLVVSKDEEELRLKVAKLSAEHSVYKSQLDDLVSERLEDERLHPLSDGWFKKDGVWFNEKNKRWVCGICKSVNLMVVERCVGCQMKSKNDKTTGFIFLNGER